MTGRRCRPEAAIFEATLALLAEHGFAGLTMDAIAARARVGKATIYRHWGSKAELVIDAFGSLVEPASVPETGSLREDLRLVVRGLVAAITRPPLARMLPPLVDAAERDARLAELHGRFTEERRRGVKGVLERAVARGQVSAGTDLDLAVDLLAGPVFYRRLISHAPLDAAVADRVVDAVLPLLVSPAAGAPADAG